MVPYIKTHKVPLLPFEKELIRALGATEEEYRFFVAEAEKLSRRQPAGYEHIPDVRAVDLAVLAVTLLIGVASTAASYFLAPKPRMPSLSSDKQTRQRQLSSINGSEVFAPTSGFDSQAQLATYGEPIPIIFGLYTGPTGGILVSPKLVWSRAFSYGTQQGVKLMFVVGEQGADGIGIPPPELQGILLGTTPLSAAFQHAFAFYWNAASESGQSRVTANDLLYGTRNGFSTGDPEQNSDVTLLPMSNLTWKPSFSTSYSPSSNTSFGVYSGIHNASDYRVNFRLVPIVRIPDATDDPKNQLLRDRIKIAGNYLGTPDIIDEATRDIIKAAGQKGIGRSYSRRMGIISVNGVAATVPVEFRTVAVGSTCVFEINPTRIPATFYVVTGAEGTKVDDINGEIDSLSANADSQMQLGETFQIGMTLWKVTARLLPIWKPGQTQRITLTCIELLEASAANRCQIGLVQSSILTNHVIGDNFHIAPTYFYPVLRTQLGLVRNSRPCDATEFGIKSTVYNRSNGLCNFSSLPNPVAFRTAEQDRIAINSGTMTLYMSRTSVFYVYVRPAGTTSSGAAYAWSRIPIAFCVTGEQPNEFFNFIRFIHPSRGQYEYRFVPRPGADLYVASAATETMVQLGALGGTLIALTQTTSYGSFQLYTNGTIVSIGSVTKLSQMETDLGTANERRFELDTQIADVSYYGSLLSKSNDSSPEHAISYVNEFVDNTTTPTYANLTTAVLALKASKTYASLDQIRVWLANGISVARFHPSEAGTVGPSNLITDLIYYMLTNTTTGAGNAISASLINTADFGNTAIFLRANNLLFDGAISEPVNIRSYINDLTPFFLCNFVIADGKFSLVPAVPTTTAGAISTSAVPISALFTGGNILEDSFSVEYIDSEERNSIQAVMRYRQGVKNQLPEEKTLVVRWNDSNWQNHKIESFDMTQYCTNRDHALLAAKFILSVRRRITHTVRFKTTPYGIDLAPGQFIRVVTQASPYSGANNGIVDDDGVITSATQLANGTYTVIYYKPPASAVATGSLTVSNGTTSQSAFFGSVFTVTTASTSSNVYMIERLTMDEDGMVEISASEFPTNSSYSSLVAQDLLSTTAFVTEG